MAVVPVVTVSLALQLAAALIGAGLLIFLLAAGREQWQRLH